MGWPDYIYTDSKNIQVFSGKKAEEFFRKLTILKDEEKPVSLIKGMCACPGKAKGVVKIIETIDDIVKMNHGDILLSETTYPALVPAMKKASAIVTNVGGLTCHAAIISRELKIPCIVGTKIATKVFRDGNYVLVDANKGVITKLKDAPK